MTNSIQRDVSVKSIPVTDRLAPSKGDNANVSNPVTDAFTNAMQEAARKTAQHAG